MAKRIGRCPNIDGCTKAMNDEIQEIDDLDDFICKECGHELEEVRQRKKKSSPLPFAIIGAVVVIGIIAGLIFAFGGGDNDDDIVEPTVSEQLNDSASIVPEVIPNRNDTLVIITGDMQQVTPEETEEEAEVEEVPAPETAKATPTTTTSPKTTPVSSSHKLSYGTWTGGLKNGQPHGTGTMTYSTSHTIDSRDTKGRVARPGEYIVGEWDNGHLVQGRWFKKDGTKEAIIIGKAG